MDNWLEYAAVAFGIIYVLMASRSNVWCWPAGIISSFIYIYINFTHQLFQDAILQSYYVLAGFYGWWLWNKKGNTETEIAIQSFSLKQNFKLICFGVLLFPILGFLFSKIGNSLSYFDSAITVFSFIATWMTAKKILENWLYWIVIDVVAATMYFIKDLQPTSGLYIFFALVAAYGYFEWRKKISAA